MASNFFKMTIFVLLAAKCYAQEADTLTYAEGRIINAATKEPISARISYQSLPYGSRVGVLNNNSYSFPMFDNEKYSITVEAPGFSVAKFLLDPAEANGERKVVKNIELTIGDTDSRKHSAGQLLRLNNLIFQVGKAKISPESYDELNLIVNMMKENNSMIIQLEGHTDYQGDAKENLKLSQARVDATKEYLVKKGINKSRVKTKAFGGTQPLSRDNTPEAHRLNRRVELRILED